jgi:hypothetical protein
LNSSNVAAMSMSAAKRTLLKPIYSMAEREERQKKKR